MFNLLKTTLLDLLFLYKNFIHWNLSKIFIKIYGFLLATVSIIPFLLFFFIDSLDEGNSFNYYIGSLLSGNWGSNILGILASLTFIVFFFFSYILLFNLNLSYLKGEKLDYLKNRYLDINLFTKYLFLSLSIFGFLLIPFVFFIFILLILIFVLGGIQDILITVDSGPINAFSILALLFFISSIYIFYRLVFSYFYLLEDKNNEKNIKNLLLESFENTKGFSKSIKTGLLFIIFGFFYLGFFYPGAVNGIKYSEVTNYKQYINLDENNREIYKSRNNYYYSGLELSYGNFSDDEINKLVNYYFYKSLVLKIFEFLFVYGFIPMLLTSIYFRVIKNNEIIKKETKVEKIKKIAKKLSFKNKEL